MANNKYTAHVNPETQLQNRCEWTCRVAGVKFIGIQKMYGTRPDQLLFQPRIGIAAGTTLAVPIDAVPLAVAYRILDAEKEYAVKQAA